jgi:hypothetical protein
VKGIRQSATILLSGLVIFAGISTATAWADTPSVDQAEAQFVARLNSERTSRGLAPLAVAGDMAAIARQHSADMAAAGHPYHDPNIRSEVQNWQVLGDNVGSGASVDNIHAGFMNSQIHRDEILEPRYTQVGVGGYWAGNVLYVTEIFRLPQSRAAAAPAASAPSDSGSARITVRITRTVAPANPAPAPAAPTTTPTTTAPTTTTVAPRVTVLPWPPATALNTQRVSRSSPAHRQLPAAALAAAVLLAAVAGVQVRALRRSR